MICMFQFFFFFFFFFFYFFFYLLLFLLVPRLLWPAHMHASAEHQDVSQCSVCLACNFVVA